MQLAILNLCSRRWIIVAVLICGYGSLAVDAQAQTNDNVALRIRFGLRDQEPTNWSGSLQVSSGSIVSIRGWRWSQADRAEGNSWNVRTRRKPAQNAAERRRIQAGEKLPVVENGILVTLAGCEPDAELRFQTEQGTVTFRLDQVPFHADLTRLNGNLRIDRTPAVRALAATKADEDYPATAIGPDGSVYVAYLSFTRGRDFQGRREQVATTESDRLRLLGNGNQVRVIEQPSDLAYLAQPAGGEQLYLRILRDGTWSEPIAVADGPGELYRPAVAVDGDGRVWVFYSAHLEADKTLDHGNWELLARSFAADGSEGGEPVNISRAPGADFMPAAATDSAGRVWVTWVGARGKHFQVHVAGQQGDAFAAPVRMSPQSGNAWEPAIAADRAGRLAVAWDTFEKGDYDVYVAIREAGQEKLGTPRPVAASLAFEVRPSLAYDPGGRLWMAYEYSGDQWGKDFGALKKMGIPLYQTGRSLGVKVRSPDGQWMAPPDVMEAMPGAAANRAGARSGGTGAGQAAQPRRPARRRSPVTSIAPTYPRLAVGPEGSVWLAFRGKPGGNWRVGVGSVWFEYLTRLDGDAWTRAAWVPHSNNILDNRPALLAAAEGLWMMFSGDGRGESPFELEDPHLPNPAGSNNQRRGAARNRQADPNNQVLITFVPATGFGTGAAQPQLQAIDPPQVATPTAAIGQERRTIEAMRNYRVALGDESLRIWRGEFHRHTELSPDGGGDGGLLDMWRYAIDASELDWIGDGDHDYGNGREYSWWTTQKAVTLFTLPDAFVPVYSYERSVRYPEGHRNCMFAYRGVRSLPRLPLSDPEVFAPAPDTELLYKYLHYFSGICASHTSATDMGTDWRNHDPVVEPFVEIYQGDRNNYERPDSPRSAVTEARLKQSTPEKESIGGWRPKGFVNLALLKGYRLAFQSSSDHISTHLSYCNVFVTEPTRQGIVDAIRKRRVYGATDNIIADVRCRVGEREHFMGEEFTTPKPPTIDVTLIGTQKFANVVIIKDDVEVYRAEPGTREVKFKWTDPAPEAGKTSYYYVRGEQVLDWEGASAGELVWASPMWIKYAPQQ